MMTRSCSCILTLVLLSSSLSFSDVHDAFPDWRGLEKDLYNNPKPMLEHLLAMDQDILPSEHQASYYDLLTAAYVILSDYDSARISLMSGLEFQNKAKPYVLINLLATQSYFEQLDGNLENAEADYLSILRIAEQLNSVDAQLSALNALVDYYSFTVDELEIALEYVQLASAISVGAERQNLVGDLRNLYGNIHSYMGDDTLALEQYEIAQEIYQEEDNRVGLSSLLYNKAMSMETQENYLGSLRTYQFFIETAMYWGDPTAEFYGQMGKASVYRNLERTEKAHEAVLLAYKTLHTIVDSNYLFDFWMTAAHTASDAGDIEFAEKAVSELTALSPQVIESKESWEYAAILKAKKSVAKSKGDFEEALALSEEVRFLQYDLLEAEQNQALIDNRIDAETAMFQSEADRLSQLSKKQQLIIAKKSQIQTGLTVICLMLFVGVVTLIFALRRQISQRLILQKYSAISESVNTAGQQVMNNAAGLMFDQSEHKQSPLSVVVFEITSLSRVREKFGEAAVVSSLDWMKELITQEMRSEDKLGQLTFDRFMLLLPGVETKFARKLTDRIIHQIQSTNVPKWADIELEVSVGISERSKHDRNPHTLTHRAGTAVDIARDKGVFNIQILAV